MSAAVCLVLFSVVVMVASPPLLVHLTRDGHTPRWGAAAWLAAIGSVLLTWLAAVVAVVIDVVAHWNQPMTLAAFCLHHLHGVVDGSAGPEPQLGLLAAALGAASAAAVLGVRWARILMRVRVRAHEHAEAVRLVGRCSGDGDLVVLDATQPAAYCVAGRPPAVVVTTGALAVLNDRQLDAVLAHERAHLAGHHAFVVAALHSLAAMFRHIRLIAHAAVEVPRLLEMCADDAAARRYGKPALLAGLIALSGAAPADALGVADVAVFTRAQRLTRPCRERSRVVTRAALAGVLAVSAGGPVLVAALMALAGAFGCGT